VKCISYLKYFVVLLSAGLLSVLAGCGGGGGTSTTGTLKLALTDAPSCGYDHVYVTVDRVRVHQSTDAQDSDAGWSEVVLNSARKIDLLELTNGVLEELGQTALPAGHYTQMRLVLVSNSVTPFANSVVPSGGSETELDTPSGQQTGLKMNVNIDVAADKVADFVLDFNACKSVVTAGKSGKYNLKPVVSVIPRLSDAGQRIVGYVDLGVAATAAVSVQSAGVIVKATQPDSNGQFVLYPVPAGSYDLVVTAPGHVTALISGVPVINTAYTFVGSASNAILPPTSATSEVADGTVSVGGSVADTLATVRALQTYTGGTVVEVAGMPVDAVSGAYAFTLPVDAPAYTTYNANTAVTIAFTQDDPRAGRFNLEASAPGQTPQLSLEINLGSGPSTTNFTF